jgi:hypothetical protein
MDEIHGMISCEAKYFFKVQTFETRKVMSFQNTMVKQV